MLADWSARGWGFSFASGERGDEVLSGLVRMTRLEAAYWRERRGQVFVRAVVDGIGVWDGRLEDVLSSPSAALGDGVRVQALGGFRAYSDVMYTALWSAASYANWEPVTADDHSSYNPELYQLDNNNRLYFAPVTGQTYAAGSEVGGMVFKAPHNGNKGIEAVSFTFSMTGASGWTAAIFSYSEDFGSGATEWTLAGEVSAQSGAQVVELGGAVDYVVVAFYRPSSGTMYSGDVGAVHFKMTNVRVVTSTAEMIDTTLGTNVTPGSQVVTPGSMEHIFVGQGLMILPVTVVDTERVVVTAVTATTFTAVFAKSHSSDQAVKALYVSAEEVVGDVLSYTSSINADQVDDSTSLIEATDRDLLDVLYEDRVAADVLAELAEGHNFEVGVTGERLLYFRPRAAESRTWYVDASVSLERTLEALRNSAYGVFADGRGRTLRTAYATDSDSAEGWGIVRQAAVYVDTTSQVEAEGFRDSFLETHADPDPRAVLAFTHLWTVDGVLVPLFFLRAGDSLVARNVAGNPQFLVARREYLVDENVVLVEPSVRPPSVEEALAKGITADELARRVSRSRREKVRVL